MPRELEKRPARMPAISLEEVLRLTKRQPPADKLYVVLKGRGEVARVVVAVKPEGGSNAS